MKKIYITCDVCGTSVSTSEYKLPMKKIIEDMSGILEHCEASIYNAYNHSECDMCPDCISKFMKQEQLQ